MHARVRNLFSSCALLLPLAAVLAPVLNAQAAADEDGPPKVLVIHREYLKPGKGGMIHDRSESAFVHAFADAKSPYHYFAMDSLSGPSRSLFFFSYDSFADWEKENAAISSNKALAAKVDQASLTDGDLLAGYDAAAMMLRPDLSLNKGSIDGARYFEITVFVVKPGHMHDFAELSHLYIDAYKKIAPETHWDTFEVMYGNPLPTVAGGGVFLVFNLMKSLAETDKSIQNSDKFAAELGADGMKKVSELTAASVEATSTNLFAINPRISNPPAEWVKKDPGFWKAQ
jgi:hypothetical protein